MDNAKIFANENKKIVELLKKIKVFLEDGRKFENISIDEKLIEKVNNGISLKENEKLKVALIGEFSGGKTSIAAAWTEVYDKDKMKICQVEATNEITLYEAKDIYIVDTPGLFGSKENENKEKYRDITKKYASEAHIVLYVMDPHNPIKDSHKEVLQWLFNDLQLLDRTIFVIGRFDEEVDIEDEDEYNDRLKIKRENIISSLRDFDILSNGQEVDVIGVSSNPFEKGIDFCLQNIDEYKKLSHIEVLQETTANKIINLGKKDKLILSVQKSIISDILKKELPKATELMKGLKEEIDRLNEFSDERLVESQRTGKIIEESRRNLKDFVVDLFTDLILQAKATSLDTIYEFFERNIGDEGIVLETKIQNEFEKHLDLALNSVVQFKNSYNSEILHFNNKFNKQINQGMKIGGNFIKNAKINKEVILVGRDVLKLPIKFKPWGAVKLANGINKALPIIGILIEVGVDVLGAFDEHRQKKEFEKAIDTMVENFNKQRKELIDFLDDREMLYKTYFQSYLDLNNEIENVKKEVEHMNNLKNDFEKWKEMGEVIDVEFEELN